VGPRSSDRMRRYLLGLLCLAALLNFLDRQIFSILLVSIKADLHVSDTAMGLLSGAAFAILYVIAGLPLARWADVGVRRSIMALSLAVWSCMTLFCGVAQNYLQLLVGRMGVAIGEAGSIPATYSMVSDLYPAKRRAGIIGTLYFFMSVGIGISLLAGGWLNDAMGWRLTLITVAVPGLVLALMLRLTVREPSRLSGSETHLSVVAALVDCWACVSYRYVLLFAAASAFTGYGVLAWAPAYLIRVHGLTASEAGFGLGFGMFVGSAAGGFCGGKIADRLASRDMRWLLWIAAAGAMLALPFGLVFLHSEAIATIFVSFGIYQFLFASVLPPCYAAALNLARPHTRALATALVTMFQNLGGVALGPLVAGIVNDRLASTYGVEAVRHSLTYLMLFLPVTSLIAWLGSRHIVKDMAQRQPSGAFASTVCESSS
jgi:predicted MFS family arabinose efflux permease